MITDADRTLIEESITGTEKQRIAAAKTLAQRLREQPLFEAIAEALAQRPEADDDGQIAHLFSNVVLERRSATPAMLAVLRRQASATEWSLREQAIWALGRFKDLEAVELLFAEAAIGDRPDTGDDPGHTVAAVAGALGKMGLGGKALASLTRKWARNPNDREALGTQIADELQKLRAAPRAKRATAKSRRRRQ